MLPNEEPIKLYIFPFGSEECRVSHAALKYGNDVIHYGSQGFLKDIKTPEDCYIYNIYPSEVGINPKKLTIAIKKRKTKIKGKDYNYFTENCADQVISVLKEAGAKDIKECLGIAIPKLDGLASLDDWAEKHGTLEQIPASLTIHHYLKAMTSKNKFKTPFYFKLEEDRESIAEYVKGICNPKQHPVYKIPTIPFQSYKVMTQEECAQELANILMSYPKQRRNFLIKNHLEKLAENNKNISKNTAKILIKAGIPASTFKQENRQFAQELSAKKVQTELQ